MVVDFWSAILEVYHHGSGLDRSQWGAAGYSPPVLCFDKLSGELPILAMCYKKCWPVLCAIEPTIGLSRVGCVIAKITSPNSLLQSLEISE